MLKEMVLENLHFTTPAPRFTEPTRDDWKRTAVYLVTYAGVVGISTFVLLPTLWYVWAFVAVAGLIALVYWHTKTFAYRCAFCHHEFTLSFVQNLVSPQGFKNGKGWKYVACPQCHDRGGAIVLKRLN